MLADIEAASRCAAFVGTLDAHLSELILGRMISRAGVVPPFYSLVGAFCPLSDTPADCRNFPFRGEPPSLAACARGEP